MGGSNLNLKDLFLGLQHVGLPTDRYEETISFYHRIGFETYDTEINGASRVCFLRLNDLILEVYAAHAPSRLVHGITLQSMFATSMLRLSM